MDELKSLVGVIGNQARIYGELDKKTGIRPLKSIRQFTNYGQALMFARDYEENGRAKKK